jgi:hypothetical protein
MSLVIANMEQITLLVASLRPNPAAGEKNYANAGTTSRDRL